MVDIYDIMHYPTHLGQIRNIYVHEDPTIPQKIFLFISPKYIIGVTSLACYYPLLHSGMSPNGL